MRKGRKDIKVNVSRNREASFETASDFKAHTREIITMILYEMEKIIMKRFVFYMIGMIVLAFGISLNAKTSLGVSPIISTAYCASSITGYNFGNMTFLLYTIFVLAEVIIHLAQKQKKQAAIDCIQVIVSLIFTRFLNVFELLIPNLGSEEMQRTFAGSIAGRIIFLVVAIICTGVGAALSLNMRIVPNPGDGIVQTIADVTHKDNGFIKNCVDITCVIITCAVGLIFSGKIIGIGIGTLMAMIGVGRVIAVFNRLTRKQTEALFL
jgi:uncharacterized membrane protein YczE